MRIACYITSHGISSFAGTNFWAKKKKDVKCVKPHPGNPREKLRVTIEG